MMVFVTNLKICVLRFVCQHPSYVKKNIPSSQKPIKDHCCSANTNQLLHQLYNVGNNLYTWATGWIPLQAHYRITQTLKPIIWL